MPPLLGLWLGLLLSVGCHGQRGARGADFVRVITPHFTLYSDRPQDEAEEHARTLEWMLHGLLETGWEYHGKLPLRLNVVLLKDPDDFERYSIKGYSGYFVDNILMEPWVVLPAPRHKLELQTLIHELSHHLAYLALQNQPLWFAEGLAVYYETATLDPEGHFVLGNPHLRYHRLLYAEGIMPAGELFDAERSPSSRLYASAWLLVHYLMTEHADAFVRYQEELAHGKSHARAWLAAFPQLSETALDDALLDYLQRGEYQVLDADLALPTVSLASKRLSVADEEALHALLWFTCIRCDREQSREKALPHIDRALLLDPKQGEARLLWATAYLEPEGRLSYFRQLTLDLPDEYRAWLGLALASAGEAAGPAIERAIALAPQQPSTWLLSARYHWERGDAAGALASAERGLRLRPTDVQLLMVCAELLFQSGRCPEWSRIAERIQSSDAGRVSKDQTQRLKQMQEACAAAGTSG